MGGALQIIDTRLKRMQVGERLVRRNPLYYGPAQRDFASLQAMDLQQRVDWTRSRLKTILAAARTTRYGRRLDGEETRGRWPLLDKEDVRNDPAAFRAAGSWLATQALTGGTTGTPLQLTRSAQSVVAEQVCLDRMMTLGGVDPLEARIAVLRGDNIKPPADMTPPFWTSAIGGRRLILSSNHLTDTTLAHYVQAIERFAPDVLWVYPSALESLCRLIVIGGQRLRVPRILSSSEMLPEPVWELARAALGANIVDYYGQAERVAFAYAARAREYYFLPGYASLELLPVEEDESHQTYEIVGTSLWNCAMPLVRYRTGDLVRLQQPATAQMLLEIAHGLRPFPGVVGRCGDVLLAPDGKGVLTGIDHIQRGVARLLRLQVVQESPRRVTLRVLTAPGFNASDAEQLMRNARLKIPPSVEVMLTSVDQLERTERGKVPFVIHAPEVKAAMSAAAISGAA